MSISWSLLDLQKVSNQIRPPWKLHNRTPLVRHIWVFKKWSRVSSGAFWESISPSLPWSKPLLNVPNRTPDETNNLSKEVWWSSFSNPWNKSSEKFHRKNQWKSIQSPNLPRRRPRHQARLGRARKRPAAPRRIREGTGELGWWGGGGCSCCRRRWCFLCSLIMCFYLKWCVWCYWCASWCVCMMLLMMSLTVLSMVPLLVCSVFYDAFNEVRMTFSRLEVI